MPNYKICLKSDDQNDTELEVEAKNKSEAAYKIYNQDWADAGWEKADLIPLIKKIK